MPEKEFETKTIKPVPKPHPIISRSSTMDQLLAMTTDQLIKMLLSPDMARPENASTRQQIIKILQERKGNAFVQSLLEEKPHKGK
jgi:hypothetical protein